MKALPLWRQRTKSTKLVFGRLQRLGIQPANLCSDAVFVRRVYLDVIGTLPTAQEASAFLSDQDPNKRRALIDRLLEREEFADYWAMKWGDLLRVKSEFPINLWPNAVQAYHRWIRTCLKENMPYDRFVREMLTASGSNFRVPQVNFYRAVQSKEPAGDRPGRGPDLHGGRGRRSGRKSGCRAWRPSSRRSATSPRGNGRRRSSSSIRDKARQAGRRGVARPCFPTASRRGCLRTGIRARSLPIG